MYCIFVEFGKVLLIREKSLRSVNICFFVNGFPHKHFGGGSCFSMKEQVNLQWLIRRQFRVVSSIFV